MLKKITIIYAEDDRDAANLVKFKLENEGFTVKHFPDGRGVAKAAEEFKADLLILDNSMPFKDGITVLRELKLNPVTNSIPVIVTTASSIIDDVKTILSLGISDFLVKPFLPQELIPRIKKILKIE